jgi:FAD/FMN-containing dehydrogenase
MNAPTSAQTIFLDQLMGELGPVSVLAAADADLVRHGHVPDPTQAVDRTPLAVAYPRSTADVSTILRLCHQHHIAVTPQGGLTGMVGGAIPGAGGLILSLERMREIEEVDVAAATMTVQAGVPLQAVQERAEACDLFFPLDLGARGSCMIGGNIATNAGGNRVLRYGMMRELVLGLEVVLADGTIVTSLNKMLKNNAGYDWKHLFIGSEGTLGITTRAVLRLYPKPRTTNVALCGLATFDDVLAFLKEARSMLGGDLSAFEVMWKEFYEVAVQIADGPPPLEAGYPFYVLIEALGSDEQDDGARFERLLERFITSKVVKDAVVAQSAREVEGLWAIRDSSGELDRVFGEAVNFDVSIPTGNIAAFADDCRSRLREALGGGEALVFGHIADSNLHLSCKGPDGIARSGLIDATVYAAVRDWGGSISAEHGIGVGKRDYLPYSRTPSEIDLMWKIKHSLDPTGILNPGKVLPAQRSSDS